MGYVFEDLIRRFNEALNENPGEHFTPREVIRLMVGVLLAQDRAALAKQHVVRTVYDPCCGSGGMLTIAKERITERNPQAEVHLFGQEVNPQTYAVSKSDLYVTSADGRDADNIAFGSTLSADRHADRTFDYLLANPPYGKDWRLDEQIVRAEATRGDRGRFEAGLPRISDGQLLFLQHMVARMHRGAGLSRVAIIMNGSPLFTGDAGSGESEIRRWILERDYLEALIAMPEQIFYNTGIATYVWVLSNHKADSRRGKVQLIDASDAWAPLRKNLGEKRREIAPDQIAAVGRIFEEFREGKFAAPVRRAVLDALSERDETAEICCDADGSPEPDPDLRDTENVPLGENVGAFVEREVTPHVPDAWIDESVRDDRDGEVGKVGYEINFNRYFYEYKPPRPLEEIEVDIKAVEQDVLKLLREVAG